MRFILFIVVAVAQLGCIGWMLGARELVLRKGQAARFVVEPVDPYDPFRGRYVALAFPESTVSGIQDTPVGQSVYALIDIDEEGYASITRLQADRPEGDSLYLEVVVLGHRRQSDDLGEEKPMTRIGLPFDRYYMNEHTAPEAERIYREASREGEPSRRENYLVVKILKGRAVAEQLVLRGAPL